VQLAAPTLGDIPGNLGGEWRGATNAW